MSIKRIITLSRKKLLSFFVLLSSVPVIVSVVVGLSLGFTENREWFDHLFLPLYLDFIALMIGSSAMLSFSQALQLEKNNRTAEMLFSTPVTTREYMFSLWLKAVFSCVVSIYLAMALLALPLGIERLGHVSPLVWLQPPLLVIAFVSGSGLALSIMLQDSSIIKKIFYLVIVFAPIAIVKILVWIMFITAFIGIADLPESLPCWVSWSLETLQTVREIVPSFIYSPWARWLPTAVYMLVWFFILSRKIHIGKFIRPFAGWRSAFVPW